MPKHSKRVRANNASLNKRLRYTAEDAITQVKSYANAKFTETVELHIKLGADPAKGDQNVRGSTTLPHGTGKTPKVAVFADGEAAEAAAAAGADRVGADDLVQAISEGWDDFDILVAQPSMMRILGPLGRKLGPRMPSKKAGNITEDVAGVVAELKGGRFEYRMDRGGGMHVAIGKVDFTEEQLLENLLTMLSVVQRARPASVTGKFIRSAAIASTMGPGMKLDLDVLLPRAQ